MKTPRENKMCWAEECEDNAEFGTIFCNRHYEMFLEETGEEDERK